MRKILIKLLINKKKKEMNDFLSYAQVILGTALVAAGLNEEGAKGKSLVLTGVGGIIAGVGGLSFDYATEKEKEEKI